MPRNSSGTMTLPAPGVPFQSGQTISSAQVNATLTDLATEVGSSLDRSGRGGALAPIRGVDGTVAAPAVSFTGEPASGLYRAAANDVRLAVGGVDALKLTSGGIAGPITMPSGTTAIQVTLTNGFLLLQGNLDATQVSIGSRPADVVMASSVLRTAGFIAQVQNNGTGKLGIDYQGLLQLQNAAAIQPASLWTAIVPNANIAGTGGPAYFKDAAGMVHLKGGLTNNTGGVATTFVTTNPLPVGFRPLSARTLPGALSGIGAGSPVSVQVDAAGGITTIQNVPNSITLSLDAVSFMAEQ